MKKSLLSCIALATLCVANANALTIEDVAGKYAETYSYTGDGYYIKSAENVVDSLEIIAIDEANVIFEGLMGCGETINGIVDLESNTIIIAPQTIFSYYTLSAATSVDDPVIATIGENGTISFSNAQMTCWGVVYGSNVKCDMVRYAASTNVKLFEVEAQVYAIDSESVIIYQGMTTLTKYSEGAYPYTIADYSGNNIPMKFYVDADGCIHTNGSSYQDWDFWYYQYWMGFKEDYLCFDPTVSEIEDNGPEAGTAVLYGNWYEDYDNYLTTCHYIYYYINWGANIQDLAIDNVAAEKTTGEAYRLDGRRADKEAKGLMIRDGKAMFVK